MDPQEHVWNREYGRRGTYWGKMTKSLPPVFEGNAVLEVGVGNGKTLMSILEQRPHFVAAVDFSHQALKLCRKSVPKGENLAYWRADLLNLPFADGAFDVVVLYYVLDNMLAIERAKAVVEARRVLADGGRVVFEDFAVGDFREKTAKWVSEPEPHTILKVKGLICHYFTEEEVLGLFDSFRKKEATLRISKPIKNKDHLVRRTVSGVMEK
jgi:MPBQ/MSBQ methyltransferase